MADTEAAAESVADSKVYELVIPRWNAIGRDYPGLEIRNGEAFEAVSSEFAIKAGTQLRGAPELLENMLQQGFVKEVTNGDNQ